MREFWLIRHAQSLANIGEATSTPAEIPLSDEGRRQARELAEHVGERPDLIIRSPYRRANDTAEPMIYRFEGVHVETLGVQEFTYLSIARCRGTDRDQRKPLVDAFWQRSDPNFSDGDQAESFAEFIGRCRAFARDIFVRDFELAFVFTHEQFIKGLMWSALNLNAEMTHEAMSCFQKFMISFAIPNTAISRVRMDADGSFYFGKLDSSNTQNNA